MDLSDVTIVFTFYCEGELRRKYLQLCLKSVFGENNTNNISILVIDGSPADDAHKNKKLFGDLQNVEYIIDETLNPFVRCKKHFGKIKTPYVLRLLEDCVYLNFADVIAEKLVKDIELLEDLPEYDAVQYPIINEQHFRVEGDFCYYPPIDFYSKPYSETNGNKYYDRGIERKIYSYLCNSLIYRTEFFVAHWTYATLMYKTHNHAEGHKFDHSLWKILNYNRYSRKLGCFLEYIVFRKDMLKKILVPESINDIHVLHIGYYSTEVTVDSFVEGVRKRVNGLEGVCSMVSRLEKFKDTEQLDRFIFMPDKKMPLNEWRKVE